MRSYSYSWGPAWAGGTYRGTEAAGLVLEDGAGGGSSAGPCWQPPSPKEEPVASDPTLRSHSSVLYPKTL